MTERKRKSVNSGTVSEKHSTGNGKREITAALNSILADLFTLYVKTKNFHWHVSGPHFRDYHLMFDEQAGQIIATTDAMAERVLKVGGTTVRSIGQIARESRLNGNEAETVAATDMLIELRDDNRKLCVCLQEAHAVCQWHEDVATASLIENWIDEADQRVWFLTECARKD